MQEPGPRDIGPAIGTDHGSTHNGDAPIVGIGASAGGLGAFTRLLRHLAPDTGSAFVLVQHLDASHPSSLSDILGRATAMPVGEVSDGLTVTPNRVYVIPPNTELTIADRVLRLAPRGPLTARKPIDRFLQSLAEDCGDAAVGVILSGNGSDGAAGLMAIKNAGGMTFAQEPTTAEFPSMPSMAAAAGAADIILPPEAIAAELARVVGRPRLGPLPHAVAPGSDREEDGDLRAICDVMHEATGIDFSLYRETTVHRRILRRVAIRNVASLGEYGQLLARDPAERTALQRDLLIGVTRFFRDPASFDALKKLVFPVIVRDRPAASTIRIWVPGCATGEEAYSILMALQEYQSASNTAFPVQVFASDISEVAIGKARIGRYPVSIAADVSPERLERHFTKVDGAYQIAKDLRERCVFSHHNLIEDPPFSTLDLISCRNVLIYLDAVQRQIIPLFHYALAEHGFLMLGRSESTHYSDLFAPVEPHERIYSKKRVARRPYGALAITHAAHRAAAGSSSPAEAAPARRGAMDWSRDADRILLSKYSPAGVLVDDNLEVLEIRGQTAPFLALAAGKASLHLLKFVPDTGLFLEVERLTQEAARTGESVRREHVPYRAHGRSGEVNVEVIPLRSRERHAYLILFEVADSAAPGAGARGQPVGPEDDAAPRDAQIATLNHQLEVARARLLSLVDEHETSDEENQQITEDALSANEELQSLTEELETAKEELQSTNEELLTLNHEIESTNVALASALDLTNSIVETVGTPLIVVGADLRVRQINAAFARAFQVSPGSADGRSLYELCGGAWDTAPLRLQIGSLLAGRKSFDPVEIAREFPAIGTRVLTVSGFRLPQLGSILLTIEDITQRRQAEEALQSSEEQRRQSEKMETVGRLAGGIAHDFNNLLTVIVGHTSLLGESLGSDPKAEQVAEIRRSAERAAALTDQLLSFSRRKVLQPRAFDLNGLIDDFEKMLRRLVDERVRVVLSCATDPCYVKADPAEVGRVLMNLCLNAKDAMPAGGTLTIETGRVDVDEAGAARHEVPGGPYIQLVVRDTGVGMDAETRLHAFEPFFSTKDASQGAGLGLATVFGILKESGGAISCDSNPGAGTQFTVLLPVAPGPPASVEAISAGLAQAPKGSMEVVLLAEDEASVRRLTKTILERAGYVVLEATDGGEGVALLQSHEGPIDILVSDVVMPGMSGRELAERAVALRPNVKVLFLSGHTEDVALKDGVIKGAGFLAKPFSPAALARNVRELLDAK